MSGLERYNEGKERSSKSTSSALCESFNKLQVRKTAKTCFYEDYLLQRTKLFLLENDEVDPSIPSKLGDIIQILKKFLQDVPLHIRRSKQCIEDFYRMLLFLQDYLGRYVEIFKHYPLTQDLLTLLIEYVELEYEVLYFSDIYSAEYQKQVENRILTFLLLFLYDSTEKNGTNRKNRVDCNAIYALYIIKNVKADYKREHDLIENLMSKLLMKLNVFETMNAIRKENVDSINPAKLLQVPRLQEISKHLQNCSYINDITESDDEIQEIDIPRPMKIKAEEIEVKVDISQLLPLNVDENLNSDNKKLNVHSRNSNKCKCGHYNCGISCVDRTIMCISDDEDNSDVEFAKEEPLPVIDLEVEEKTSEKNKREFLTKNETRWDSRSNSPVEDAAKKVNENQSENERIEAKVDLSQYVHLNNDENDGTVLLLSDDDDDSDIEIIGSHPVLVMDLQVDENASNQKGSTDYDKNVNTNQSEASTSNESREQNKTDLQLRVEVNLLEKSNELTPNENESVPNKPTVESNNSDIDALDDIDFHENISHAVNAAELEDEETHNELTKNIIDQLDNAIQDSESSLNNFRQDTIIQSKSEEELHQKNRYDNDTIIMNDDLETEDIAPQNEETTVDAVAKNQSEPIETEKLLNERVETENILERVGTEQVLTETVNIHVEPEEIVPEIIQTHVKLTGQTEELIDEHVEVAEISTELIEPEEIVTKNMVVVEPEEIVDEHVEEEITLTETAEPEKIVNEPVEAHEILSEVCEVGESVDGHIQAQEVESAEISNYHVETEEIIDNHVHLKESVNEPVETQSEVCDVEESVDGHIQAQEVEAAEISNHHVETEDIVHLDESVNGHVETDEIVNGKNETEVAVSEHVEPVEAVNEYIVSEEVVTYADSQDLIQEIVVEEIHTSEVIHEEIVESEHFEDDTSHERSSLNDSGVFERSPSGDTEGGSTPTYSCDLNSEVQDGSENSADNELTNTELSNLNLKNEDQRDKEDIVNDVRAVETVEVKSECVTEASPDPSDISEINIRDPIYSEQTESIDKDHQTICSTDSSLNQTGQIEAASRPVENTTPQQLKHIEEKQVTPSQDQEQLPTNKPNNEVFSTNLDVLANAASGCFKNADNFQTKDQTDDTLAVSLPDPSENVFETHIEPKLDQHISDDYVHEETVVTTEPCEIFTEQNCSNYLVVLATAAAKREKVKSVHVRSTRKNRREKKIRKKESVKEVTSKRVTRSATISKLTIPVNDAQDASKCIPSTFMNLENLVTPPPICVYNFIPSSITDDDSIDEPFSSVKKLQEILVRNVAYDEDTLDDNITLVAHEKEIESEVIISIPETEKDFPGINYDILKETEECTAITNLSLTTSEELCKELRLTMTKNEVRGEDNQEHPEKLNVMIEEHAQLEVTVENQTMQKNKKKTIEKIVHTVPIKKRRNYEKNSLDTTNDNKEQTIECAQENPAFVSMAITETILDKAVNDKIHLNDPTIAENKQEKRCSISDRPFRTKAALKCFQTTTIKCNPYVQLQKLPVICDIRAVIEKEEKKTKNKEKPKSKSLSEVKVKQPESQLKQLKTRRSTIDCMLDKTIKTRNCQKNDVKITRRRASAKYSRESLMGTESVLEADPIVEKAEVVVKSQLKVQDEKSEESSAIQTRSKANRNKNDHLKNREEPDLLEKPPNLLTIVQQDDTQRVEDGKNNKGDLTDTTPIKLEEDIDLKSNKRSKKHETTSKSNKRSKSSLKKIDDLVVNDEPLVNTVSKNMVSKETMDIKPVGTLEIDINKTKDSNSAVQNDQCELEIQQNTAADRKEVVVLNVATSVDTKQLVAEHHTDTQKHSHKKASDKRSSSRDTSCKEQSAKKHTRTNKNNEKVKLEKVKKEESLMITENHVKDKDDLVTNKEKLDKKDKVDVESKQLPPNKVLQETTKTKPEHEKPKIINDAEVNSESEEANLEVPVELADTNATMATNESKSDGEKDENLEVHEADVKKPTNLKTKDQRTMLKEKAKVEHKDVANKDQQKKDKSKLKTKSKNSKSKLKNENLEIQQDKSLNCDTNFFIHIEDVALIPLPEESPHIQFESKSKHQLSNDQDTLDKTDSADLQLETIAQDLTNCEDSNNNQASNEKLAEVTVPQEEHKLDKDVVEHNLLSTENEKPNIWTIDKIISTSRDTQGKLKEEHSESIKTLEKETIRTEVELSLYTVDDELTVDREKLVTNAEGTTKIDNLRELDNAIATEKPLECCDDPLLHSTVEERPLDLSCTYIEKNTANVACQEENQEEIATSAVDKSNIEVEPNHQHTIDKLQSHNVIIESDNCKISAIETLETSITSERDNLEKSAIDDTNQTTSQHKSADDGDTRNEVQNVEAKNVNIFSTVKLKRRNSIATDTCVLEEQSGSKHIKKKVLEKYNIECRPYKKPTKIVDKSSENKTSSAKNDKIEYSMEHSIQLETGESYISKEGSIKPETTEDVERKEVGNQLETSETHKCKEACVQLKTNEVDGNKLTEVENQAHLADDKLSQCKSDKNELGETISDSKEDRQSSDDEVVLVSIEKLPTDKGQDQEDDYAYDSEPIIDKLFEKYSKKKNEVLSDSNTRSRKKNSKEKHVRFSMERNTVKRVIPFVGEEEETDIPSSSKRISVDVELDKNNDKKHSDLKSDRGQKDVKRKHHSKNESKTKDRKKDKGTEKTEVIGDSVKKEVRKQENDTSAKTEGSKKSHKNSSKHEKSPEDSRKRGRNRDNSATSQPLKKIKLNEDHVSKKHSVVIKSNEKLHRKDSQRTDKKSKKPSKVKHAQKLSKTVKSGTVGKYEKDSEVTGNNLNRPEEKIVIEPVQSDFLIQSIEEKNIPDTIAECDQINTPDAQAENKEVDFDTLLRNPTVNDCISADEAHKNTVCEDQITVQEEIVEASLSQLEEQICVKDTVCEVQSTSQATIVDLPVTHHEEQSCANNIENEDQNSLHANIVEAPLSDLKESNNEEQNCTNTAVSEDQNSWQTKTVEESLSNLEECKNEVRNCVVSTVSEDQGSLQEKIDQETLSGVEECKSKEQNCTVNSVSEDQDSLQEKIVQESLSNVEECKNEVQNCAVSTVSEDQEKIVEVPSSNVEECKNGEQNCSINAIIEDQDSPQIKLGEAPLIQIEECIINEQTGADTIVCEDENSVHEKVVDASLPHENQYENEEQDCVNDTVPEGRNSLQGKIVEASLTQVEECNNEEQISSKSDNEEIAAINDDVEEQYKTSEGNDMPKKKRESKRIDIIIENLKNKTKKLDNTEQDLAAIIHSKIDHEEHVRSDNLLDESDSSHDLTYHETTQNLDKTDEAESFFSEFNLDQSKLQVSQCEDIFPYIDGSKKDDCLLEMDSNENSIQMATSLAENSVSLLDVNEKQVDGADASTSCEITDNLIAVMFSEQNRSNKTGFIFFKGSDHNYHSMGDPLLGGECDTHESDHSSSDNKEIPSPELENVLVNDTILPYISTLTDNHQESSEDSGADFQLLELIGNTLARESSPPLTQTINCDNLYQPNLKQVELEYDETSTPNGVDFSKISSEVFINQFQQQTMSVENMSELMNVVLTSIQNLNNMTKPVPILQDSREGLFLPSDLDLNDVVQQAQPQNLDLICDFPQTQTTDLNLECSTSNTPTQETEYSCEQYIPVPVQSSPTIDDTSHKKVIVEHIPQYIEEQPVIELPPEEITFEKPPSPVKVTATRSKFSEAIALARQNRTSSSSPKKLLNNVGFVRSSSKTKPSAPKPKRLSDPKKEPTQEVGTPVKLKTPETPSASPLPRNVTSSPPKERSLPIIDDLALNTKKPDLKNAKVKEDENFLKAKQSPAYAKSPRTPRQSEQKLDSKDSTETLNQNDMIDNVKRRKRKPVDYSSIEKLLETDEYDYPKAQKAKNKRDDKLKGKPKEEEVKVKKLKSSDDPVPSTSSANNDTGAATKSKTSIFEDSDDDDIPKKKKQKTDTPLEAEAMNALFDRLFKEGEVKKVAKSNVARMSQDPTKPATSSNSIFSVDSGLHRKPETTPVKQIGVVNPIPRQSNHIRKELIPNRNSYGASEENRASSQYYQYYSERSRRSYPYSSRESRDSRPSSHQGSSRRQEYSTHSNDQRYSSQRSSSSSRSSRSSRHHSNSRSSTEQRGYWFESGNDLSWREDMKKKFPNVFKDEYF